MPEEKIFDVIIIGGSYSGLSAALSLGRSLKSIMVIDSGKPCNQQTPHSHNFLTRDGQTPDEISSVARYQVEQYDTVSFLDDLAIAGKKITEGFQIETTSGSSYKAKKLIFATGIKDELPEIPGFKECWGISVIHCPYCHGYEFRNKKTGIFANGDKAFHLASLVNNLTEDLTLLTNGSHLFDEDQLHKLKKNNIQIVEAELDSIKHQNGHLEKVFFKDGSKLELSALYAAVSFTQHSEIPAMLNCAISDHGHIEVDDFQKSTVPGIYACGDNSSPFRSISNAVLTGNVAGAMINMELTNESF